MKESRSMEIFEISIGDITSEHVDAIVNAANESLLGGGGVDGAIHRAAGPKLLEACRKLNGCSTGDAKATPGFNLPSKWVIHTVGPVYKNTRISGPLLESAYRRSIEAARRLGARTVSFSAISCGVYGYPHPEAAQISISTILDEIKRTPDAFDQIRIVLFNKSIFDTYQSALKQIRNPSAAL